MGERYRYLLEHVGEGVFVVDERDRCLAANPAGVRMLGYTERGIVRRRFWASHIDGIDEAGVETLRQRLKAGGAIRIERMFRRKGGRLFPGVLTAVRLADGTIQCLLRDLTDRLRSEQQTEGWLREIFEHSPVGVIYARVGADGRLQGRFVNKPCARLFGTASPGRSFEDAFPAAYNTIAETSFRRCIESGKVVECDCERPQGGSLWQLHSLLVPVRDTDGHVQGVAGFVRDITEQKCAAAALRESEARFTKIFHASPEAIVVTELTTGRVMEVNDTFLHLFGLTREQVIGRPVMETGAWIDAEKRNQVLAMLAADYPVRNFEMRFRAPIGERICLLTAEKIELHGRPCILSLVDDVTEIRRGERERNEAAERERRADADFTKRLIESQEAERGRIARELHDSLGQELLLVTNRLQLALGHEALAPALHEELESIGSLATQAVAEVRRISHALHPAQLDHLGATRALRALLDEVARTATFRLNHHLDDIDGLYPREAEANWYRIVQECLSNILKHAGARAVEVVLERDIHVVRLIVADDGCGFTPAVAEAGGFGLRSIAERVRILGGELRVDSAPGTGTRLEVTVPLPNEI